MIMIIELKIIKMKMKVKQEIKIIIMKKIKRMIWSEF